MSVSVRIGNALNRIDVSSVSVRRSLEDPMRTASVSTFVDVRAALSERWEIEFDGRRLFTGSAERRPGYAEVGFDVTGRSKTVALELFEADNNMRFSDTTDGAIVRALAGEVGLETDGDGVARVKRFKVSRSDTYREGIQRLAEAHRWVLTDDGLGRVVQYRLPADLAPVATWLQGRLPVLNIQVRPQIDGLRREIVYRGARLPVGNDVAEAVAGQIGIDIVTGNIRPSREVLTRGAATSRGDAATIVRQHARKLLAAAFTVDVDLVDTELEIGDIVYVSGRPGTDLPMVVSELTHTRSATEHGAHAVLRLPAVYSDAVNLAPDESGRVTA